ncbi:hypothetical protein DFH05DRAFT_487880 [Lentinula detonsa]|uniref:Uncharacterized protein n=1 Tax=Lentinula detonsa TaxID=2804962 RepID=A0A9W8NRU0_9AGAR|nr:hypothetical protein DFH05DRAFT_487880 [Lentinula detonsa]
MTASGAPVTLVPNGKGKVKSKSKGSAESTGVGSKSRSKNGKGRRKKRRQSFSPEDGDDEEGESEAESAEIASSDEEDDADEASAVSNLLSLRANASGLKGAPTLVAPLHHNLTSYTPSLGSMASTATLVGSVSGWGYPSSSSSSTFTPNGNTITGSKQYFSPFQTSFNPHKSYSSMFTPNGVNNPIPQFSLSKAYSSGTTPYESSASADHPGGIPDADNLHNGYHHNGIGHVQNTVSNVRSVNDMSDSEQLGAFQSNMAMSSLRSTSSALRSTNGLEGLNGSNGLDLDKGAVSRTHSLTPPSRLGSEGRENRDRVMNLDPTLAAMDMQSKHTVINKASESPTNDIDAINASSDSNSISPLASDSNSTPTPVHKPTSAMSIGSQNAEQSTANFMDSDLVSNRQTYMSPMESNGTEPRTTLRPVESEKDWRM